MQNDINKGTKNKNEITNEMYKILKERVNLLHSKKLSYKEWIDYNNKNVSVNMKSDKLTLFVYEDLLNNDNFINRVNNYKQYIGLSWQDIVKTTNDQLVFSKYTTDKDLLLNASSLSSLSKDKKSTILYYWIDPNSTIIYKRLGHFMNWEDPITKTKGIIGMYYNLENLTDNFKYINSVSKLDIILLSLITIIISASICYIEENCLTAIIKSLSFLIISNFFILYFLNKSEGINSPNTELEKLNNININVLSLSFLSGINIFILNSFKNENKIKLFKESSIEFSIALILLLTTLMRKTNYITTDEVIKSRISNQFKFDFSILINTFIVMNYVIFLLSKRFKFNY